jgi:O-antigen/teichoic acid export membrane protein
MQKKESNPLRRKVIADSIWNLSATIIARIGGLLFTILAARILLPEGFGQYNLALSIAFIFMTFADLGINQAMIRYVSFEIDKNEKKAAAYFYYLFKIKIILAIVISLLLLVLAPILSNLVFKKPELLPSLVILSLYLFVMILEGFFECTFYINNKVKFITLKETLFQLFRLLTLVGMIFILAKSFYVVGAVAGFTITGLIVGIIIYLQYKKNFYLKKPKDYEKYLDKKRILKFIAYLTIANFSSAFFSYMDIVMLGMFLESSYIGYYKAAIGLIFAITGTLTFTGVFLSVLTKVSPDKLQKTFDKIVSYSLILVIPAIGGLIMLTRYFMVVLYGQDYLPSAFLIYYLSPLIFFVMMVSLFLVLLSSKEKTREFAFLTLFITILNIVLNFLFIKIFIGESQIAATKGVAIATLVSWFIYFIGTIRITKKYTGIYFRYRLLLKPLIASLIMIIYLYFYARLMGDMTPIKGIIDIISAAIVYFIAIILLGGIKIEDLKLFYEILIKAKSKISIFARK